MHLCYRTESVLLPVFVMIATPLYERANQTFSLLYCHLDILRMYSGYVK